MAEKKRKRKGDFDEQTDSSGLTREEREDMTAEEEKSYSQNNDENWRADDSR